MVSFEESLPFPQECAIGAVLTAALTHGLVRMSVRETLQHVEKWPPKAVRLLLPFAGLTGEVGPVAAWRYPADHEDGHR